MKNITLSADADVIERARECARRRMSTLSGLFREWLAELVEQRDAERRLSELDRGGSSVGR